MQVDEEYGSTDTYTLALTAEPLADTGEPNDTRENATPLPEGGSVTAFLSEVANDPKALLDAYRFEMTHNGPVTFDVDMSPGVAPRLEVRDIDRKHVGGQFGDYGERIHVPLQLRRGTYYLSVSSFFGMSSAGGGDLPARLTRPYTISAH